MKPELDHDLLRTGTGAQVFEHMRQVLRLADATRVFQHVLESIESEAIPGRVAAIWIHGIADVPSLVNIMEYQHSKTVRHAAITRFGLKLRSRNFLDVWKKSGRTLGLVQLMKNLSVRDISHLCAVLGRTATTRSCVEERQKCMDSLLKTLASDFFPDSPSKNPECRPLLKHYARILPACSADFVQTWLSNPNLPAANNVKLCQAHTSLFQRQCLEQASNNKYFDFAFYRPLYQRLPMTPNSKPRSARIDFCLGLVKRLAQNTQVEVVCYLLWKDLIFPLLRKLEKTKQLLPIRDTLQAFMQYLSAHNRDFFGIDLSRNGLFGFALRYWQVDQHAGQEILTRCLQLMPQTRGSLEGVANSLGEAPVRYRLDLLKQELLNIPGLQIDLADGDSLSTLQYLWPSRVFFALPSEAAMELLLELKSVRQREDFLDCSKVNYSLLKLDHLSQTIMHEILLRKKQDPIQALEQARRMVEESKQRAMESRVQITRAKFAQATLAYSIATASLDSVEDVILWLRRYNGDPLSLREIYAASVLESSEMVQLLSGVSTAAEEKQDLESTKRHIKHANRIIMMLLETACLSLRDPSFMRGNWNSVFALFGLVTADRAAHAPKLQLGLGCTDDQLYDSIFAETLGMLLEIEHIGLSEEYSMLNIDSPGGPLQYQHIGHFKWSAYLHLSSNRAVCRFADELARSRDVLWEDHRKRVRPAVAVLPPPWPRGLPFQNLLPFEYPQSGMETFHRDLPRGEVMPFLYSKAESVVFVGSKDALIDSPTDDETQMAIGGFIDDYKLALRFYVYSNPDEQSWRHLDCYEAAQRSRMEKAWRHAVDNLARSELGSHENLVYWFEVFNSAGVKISWFGSEVPVRREPSLPAVESPGASLEWNPDPDYHPTKSKELRRTCLDCIMQGGLRRVLTANVKFQQATSNSPETLHSAIWQRFHQVIPKPSSLREALVAAALLVMNSESCPQTQLLASPFPSSKDIRFAAMFLDDEFLDREDPHHNSMQSVARALKNEIPASLLMRLCETMLQQLDSAGVKNPSVLSKLFSCIKLIMKGDKPQASLEIIRHVIIRRPDDSSWHRQILTPSFLRILPTDTAKSFLLSIVGAVVTAMEQQAKQKVLSGAETAAKPAVKITTIKLVAQLLIGADFIDEDTVLELLTTLFMGATHIDARAAIIDSVIAMMQSTKSERIVEKSVQVLESCAVPVAAQVNERQPMSREDWQRAEVEGKIPEVAEGFSAWPISDALIQATEQASGQLQDALISRTLLPLIAQSAANNQRWMRLFLRVNKLGQPLAELPAVPVRPNILVSAVTGFADRMPMRLLNVWHETVMYNVTPDRNLQMINNAINLSAALRSSNAGRHWFKLWNNTGTSSFYYWGATLPSLLNDPINTKIPDGITYQSVVGASVTQIRAVIQRGDETLNEQAGILGYLKPPFHSDQDRWNQWRLRKRPLLVSFISEIDSLRTEAWQTNPYRTPTVLPDTYPLKLWLLSYPPSDVNTPFNAEIMDVFARELIIEIEKLANSGRLYHRDFEELKKASTSVGKEQYPYLGARIGSLDGPAFSFGIAGLLRVELADNLLREGQRGEQAHAQMALGMLEKWRMSENEDIRMIAIKTLTHLKASQDQLSWWKSVQKSVTTS